VKKIQQEIVGNNQTTNKPPSNNKNLTKTLAVLGIVAVGIIFASWIVAKKRKLKNK
jgi:hypothetical protein